VCVCVCGLRASDFPIYNYNFIVFTIFSFLFASYWTHSQTQGQCMWQGHQGGSNGAGKSGKWRSTTETSTNMCKRLIAPFVCANAKRNKTQKRGNK